MEVEMGGHHQSLSLHPSATSQLSYHTSLPLPLMVISMEIILVILMEMVMVISMEIIIMVIGVRLFPLHPSPTTSHLPAHLSYSHTYILFTSSFPF